MENEAEKIQREADRAMVNKHVQALMEHFDTVQIFVTRHMPSELDATRMLSMGAGNWFARSGQVREWVIERDGGLHQDGIDSQEKKE